MHAVEHSRKLILARLLHRKIRNETAETVYTCLFVYCSIFVVCQTNNNNNNKLITIGDIRPLSRRI